MHTQEGEMKQEWIVNRQTVQQMGG